jgi:hypothetical protein
MSNEKAFSELANDQQVLAADRRTAERYPCNLKPSWRSWGKPGGESWSAAINDISTTGISLLINYWMKPGTVLVIKLQNSNHRLTRPLPVRVMHATERADGEWLIGCAFVRRLSEPELQAILQDSY